MTANFSLLQSVGMAAAIDRAMEWGYGWELGPFRAMDALGLPWLREAIAAARIRLEPFDAALVQPASIDVLTPSSTFFAADKNSVRLTGLRDTGGGLFGPQRTRSKDDEVMSPLARQRRRS